MSEAVNQTMLRTTLRQNWTLSLGIIALIVGGLIYASAELGGGLGHLQTGEPPLTVFYWATLFFESAALPLTGILLIFSVTLIVAAIVQSIRGYRGRAIATAFGVFLSSLAIVLAVWSGPRRLVLGSLAVIRRCESIGRQRGNVNDLKEQTR